MGQQKFTDSEDGASLHQHFAKHVLIQAAFLYGRVAVDDGKGIPAAVASVGIAAEAGSTDAGQSTRFTEYAVLKQGTVHAVYQRTASGGMAGCGQSLVYQYVLYLRFCPGIAQEGKEEIGTDHVFG